MSETFDDTVRKDALLNAFLQQVVFEGWSKHALSTAALEQGISEFELYRMFPDHIAGVVRYFHMRELNALDEFADTHALQSSRVPERIEKLILARLSRWLPLREAIRRLIAYELLPWNVVPSTANLYKTVDHLWYLADDVATDFSYYTKRMTLAALYSSVLLFWCNDPSLQQTETQAFLKRRLENIAAIGKIKKKLRKAYGT